MMKFIFKLLVLATVVYLIASDTWRVMLTTSEYEVSVSFVLFIVALVVLLWLFFQIKKPFSWWAKFRNWQQSKKQNQKNDFLPELLTILLSHQDNQKNTLLNKAQKLYGKDSREVLLISALLNPKETTFRALNENEPTKLAGLYGLIQEAVSKGDYEEVNSLLQQVPAAQEKTYWVQQTKMHLALHNSDWKSALKLLEENKDQLPKPIYKSHKAVLLLKLGRVKEAYRLMPSHPAIALVYAQIAPKKAKRILEKTWHLSPSWPIYLAYKQVIKNLPDDKRLKAVLSLTRDTRDERYSLLARADMDASLQNWARAKESLEIYLQNYPLTRQVADMMANIERTAWHHEEIAMEWEQKSIESEDDSLWICTECGHTAGDWQILCPHCNAFDRVMLK